jgi:hypothetical protein
VGIKGLGSNRQFNWGVRREKSLKVAIGETDTN